MGRWRAFGWGVLLAFAVAICAIWSAQSSLSSAPVLRVALFGCLGLTGIGLTLWSPNRKSLFVAAVLLRLVLLPAPVSDDVHRYLWEGKLIRHGINPYTSPADSPAFAAMRDHEWERMNHRDRPTAYPPLAELTFAGVGALAYHPLALKLVFVACDLGTLLLLFSLLRSRELPIHYAGWYAFNPVALIGIAAEGHYDSVFVLSLTAFWWAAENKRPVLAWLALAASVQLKLVSLLLAPLYVSRESRRFSWVFVITLIFPALFFLNNLPALFEGISEFGSHGQFNDLPHLLLGPVAPSLFLALLVFVLIQHRRGRLGLIESSFWMLGGLIFFSPILHFWYLLWIAPLLALRPNVGWLLFCGMQAGYFFAWQTETSQGWWGLPFWVVWVIWTPFLGLLAASLFFRKPSLSAR